VTYKLWEGSWDDDALLQDREGGVHADFDKVHKINHVGERYTVEGPHLVSPSRQRTPLLFQAGASEAGKNFAARNAEAVFLGSPGSDAVIRDAADIRSRAAAFGRSGNDIKMFQQAFVIPASTEAEATRRAEELDEWIDLDGHLAHISGALNLDFGFDDLDTPVGEITTEGVQSAVQWIKDLVTDREPTLRDVAHYSATNLRIVGTPEQIADELAKRQAGGVDGFNLVNAEIPGTYEDFIDHVIPVLQDRGLVQREYRHGSLRRKLFGSDDRLPAPHPAAAYRGAFTPVPT
jgi:FMN-dependent oxidoreductase (nitrilotriacetate monooxygenase family)